MSGLIYYILPGVIAFFVVWILFKMISDKGSPKINGIVLLIVAYAVIALSLHYFIHYLY
ncbi:MAG: hypothetical protein PHQ74_05230 [Crocinitomicaceae bacterium]|nr:hypothetical protein [Crocinitomicaceae bacterium]